VDALADGGTAIAGDPGEDRAVQAGTDGRDAAHTAKSAAAGPASRDRSVRRPFRAARPGYDPPGRPASFDSVRRVPPVSAEEYRHAMTNLAGGVCLVTARVGDIDHAMTATAVTALSLEPPLVLVSVDHQARIHDALATTDRFAVSFLASDQTDLALHFAKRGRDLATQFDGVDTRRLDIGALTLAGALGAVGARVYARFPGGDHTLVLGELIETWTGPRVDADGAARQPLVHFHGGFGGLAGPARSSGHRD
jgi:flavin reductase (DIM6/NTAB) family NADH-FMN oxidoreductase RutF